ncbi:MAG: proline--tRNA ligase [Chlamydiales bacterium]|nr:proline--tRNA ligase [Chlamydiales bacterium]
MTDQKVRTAITPTRSEDFPEWYQQVLKAADLAENAPVRGCMIIKPWGYGIWENIQRDLDKRIKDTGHVNAYFPLFIPMSFLEKEAAHVEGFAKECAVVTHHRLEERDGKLVPTGELEEPLVIRPTSETIIGWAFSKWVESYRDLPLLINQWANVVRWEMRPRIFLRTTEFLWQEGHTVHATEAEAIEETLKMLEVYRDFMENVLGLPIIIGEKSPGERFPGADKTFCCEAMMQDYKAVQAGTSHYLGQNFAKASEIRFTDEQGVVQYGYTTSWGVTTRMIGALIMTHGDDDGIRLPPRIAPQQIVIIPVIPKPEMADKVMTYCQQVKEQLEKQSFHGYPVRVLIDKRDMRGGEKSWDWIKKGIPIRLEVGPRDVDGDCVMMSRRDQTPKDKQSLPREGLDIKIVQTLEEIQNNLLAQAKAYRDAHTRDDITTFEELKRFFTEDPDGGFVLAKWCGDQETEKMLDELKVTIRCIPVTQRGGEGQCVLTGKPATIDVILAKSY